MIAPTDEVIRLAARLIHNGVRLDLGAMATELGISRVTLFRRVGNREDLMGEALWLLSDRTLNAAIRRWDEAEGAVRDASGKLRCLKVMEDYRHAIAHDKGLRRLLDDEPAVAMRVLTDPRGRVHPRVLAAHVELLRRDVEDGGFRPRVDLDNLSFALVRLGESFLYADVLAARTPDLAAATTLLNALVEGVGGSAPIE